MGSAPSPRLLTLKVWDLESGMCIVTFRCDAPVRCCACTNDIFVAGDAGGRVHFLRLEETVTPKA
jgi:hypothetical protein